MPARDLLGVRRQAAAGAGRDGAQILHFLGRLPEEKVRADRRAEHRHDDRDRVVVEA